MTLSSDISKNYGSDEDQLLYKLKDDRNNYYSYFDNNMERAQLNKYYTYIDQWDESERKVRDDARKPTLTFNMLKPMVRAILGVQRKNTPDFEVRLYEPGADQDAANLVSDLLRQISHDSNAPYAYQEGFRDALNCGFGAMRVSIQYESPNTFRKKILINPIENCLTAYFDPSAYNSTKSDGDFCGYLYQISCDEFDREYPDAERPISSSANDYGTGQLFNWYEENMVVICNQWQKEYYGKVIVKLDNGQEMDKKDYDELYNAMTTEIMFGQVDERHIPQIVDKRKVTDFKIVNYKYVENEILEKAEWDGKYLPMVFVDGDSVIEEGMQYTIPFTNDMIDSQKMINYVGSEIIEGVIASKREKFMATPSNTEGFEQFWNDPENTKGFLPYNPDEDTGAPPHQINPPAFNNQLMSLFQQSTGTLREVGGRPEESQGMTSNAISGEAINARQSASNNTLEVYYDNLNRAIEQVARIVVDLIPHVYSEERVVALRSKEGETRQVTINQTKGEYMVGDGGEVVPPDTVNAIPDLSFGIDIIAGPSFEKQKSEAMSQMTEFLRASGNPEMFAYVADLFAANLDIQNAKTITERMKKFIVPPEVTAEEEGKPPPKPEQSPEEKQQQFENMIELGKLKNESEETQVKKIQVAAGIAESEMQVQGDKIRAAAEILTTKANIDSQERQDAIKAFEAVSESVAKGRDSLIKHLSNTGEI